jgi:hypothetical protein
MTDKAAGGMPAPHSFAQSSEPPAAVEDKLLTPEEHAQNAGNLVTTAGKAPSFGEERQRYSWQHEAAAQLHGWEAHKLATVEPLKITRAAYDAALKAIEGPVTRVRREDGELSEPLNEAQLKALKDTSGVVHRLEPHEAALSRYVPKHHKDNR